MLENPFGEPTVKFDFTPLTAKSVQGRARSERDKAVEAKSLFILKRKYHARELQNLLLYHVHTDNANRLYLYARELMRLQDNM